MPTNDRQMKNEALARASGWTEVPVDEPRYFGFQWYHAPTGRTEIFPPDFFEDPAASRSLVEWLAAQSEQVQEDFLANLSRLAVPDWDGKQRTWEQRARQLLMQFLTAPLATIAEAAFAAIEEQDYGLQPPAADARGASADDDQRRADGVAV